MLSGWCIEVSRINTFLRCWLRMVSGSDFTQAVNPSHVDETSSSKPEKFSLKGDGKTILQGNAP